MSVMHVFLKRIIVSLVLACMVGESAVAGITDVSNVPLATSGGTSVLPNLLFTLDDSYSTSWDFMPDYVNPTQQYVSLTSSKPCMTANSGREYCVRGDPPYEAGGDSGFNGVGYDPNFYYAPAVTSTGAQYLNPLLSASPATVARGDAYNSSSAAVNLSTSSPDMQYCNSAASPVCQRPGANSSGTVVAGTAYDTPATSYAMTAGQFPYRTNPANASTAVFGLPEMMSMGSFTRSSSTVTATTLTPHGLTTSDKIYVTSSNAGFNVTCVAVASTPTTTTFTYTAASSGTIAATTNSYRKCVSGNFVRATTTVTVTSTAHGLVANDQITTFVASGNAMNATPATVTAVTTDTFTYTTGTSGTIALTAGFWVRTGLYNVGGTTPLSGPPAVYAIVPVEYCSSINLTNCVQVIPPAAPPSGFNVPAPVRFCQTKEQALSPGAISDTSSATARCRSKYNQETGLTQYVYPRYGWFRRDTITSGAAPFVNRPNRTDCTAGSCTYDQEIQNYARWWTYYRTRIQMMKTALGLSLLPFIGNPGGTPKKPNAMRIGFITINPFYSNPLPPNLAGNGSAGASVSSGRYLKISDFNTTQASTFFSTLYGIYPPLAGTPLQAALARAGWIYAGKLNTGLTTGIPTTDDPIQASCQRNYTLLTTDGYWNYLATNPPKSLGNKTILDLDNAPTTLAGGTLVDRTSTVTLDGLGGIEKTFTPTSSNSEQVVCRGNNNAAFTIGSAQACGCTTHQHQVYQLDVANGNMETKTNGVVTSNVPSTTTTPTPLGCVEGSWADLQTTQASTTDKVCRDTSSGSGSVSFTSPSATISCTACPSSSRYVTVRRTITRNRNQTTVDGETTQNTTGSNNSPTYQYSVDGVNWYASIAALPAGCAASTTPVANSGNPTAFADVAGTTTTLASAPGTAVSTFSPNPRSTTGGPSTTTFTGAGTATTLADVALYFYSTPLRGSVDIYGDATGPATSPNTSPANSDVSGNQMIVKSGAKDYIPYQHMVTFGIGLADGFMDYQADYETATTGDFANIRNGTLNACFWSSGACNWAAPFGDALTPTNGGANIDDLWHAAVNGRGQYYQANNPSALRLGISSALTALNAQVAAAAASATSSPNVTQTDNQIFSTTYETNTWSGSVFAQTIDPVSGNVNAQHLWDGDIKLLSKVAASSDTRNILTFDNTWTDNVKSFLWLNLNPAQQGYFNNVCGSSLLSQCSALSGTDLANANTGSRLVGYLRGWQQDEGSVFRDRMLVDPITGTATNTVLGDTITAKPVYVRNPSFAYSDAVAELYSTFASNNANRAPRVYVGANDGYLHAFDGNTGDESWSFLPSFLMPGLRILADKNYGLSHGYFVDGSPETFDVFDDRTGQQKWKTILIGGAAGGGRGYYALDISDPANPKGLWEFCSSSTLCSLYDTDLGLTYGNPVVGKRSKDGKWVVVLTSGLNNTSPGTGRGFFYVLDALTGALLDKIDTGAGSTASPAGLMKMSAFYDTAATDATFRYVYGGDQLGNLWRLDLGDALTGKCSAPAGTTNAPCVMHVVTLTDNAVSPRAQPITTRPALTHIGTNRVLYIGTGRYLGDGNNGGLSDLTDPGAASGISWQQTFYGIMDRDKDYGSNVRNTANIKLVQQTLGKASSTERNITSNTVTWTNGTDDGWFVDFNPVADPTPGERVNIDPRLVLGTIKVVTNIPTPGGACSVGGTSKDYDFFFRSGSYVPGTVGALVGRSLGGTIAVGMAVVQLPSGAIKDIVTGADTSKSTVSVQVSAGTSGVRRFSYRER